MPDNGGMGGMGGSNRATDILSALQNAVTAIQSINISYSKAPFIGGAITTSVNTLSTTAIQVLAAGSSRSHLTFHNPNPNGVNTWVYPVTNISGATNAPTLGSLGGAFSVLPGAYLTVTDAVNSAWFAFSSSGSANPLTIMVSS
jgi:hypothetical protein